ncbi:heterokaryon incompatibility protein-domain-containing protein [Apiospora kogelbergensis]|uniref:Heterokaryon incompatibility protein-domain-containing protein n=1 Tax=Apiospora kogelbergensis TaxID=1337665 RepID=A0AAW0RCV7_9PEZI
MASLSDQPVKPAVDPDDDPEWKVQNDYTFYRPLDYSSKQIRLISIAPGSFDDPLHCTLKRHTTPIKEQDFEALSYCWGDLKDTVTITLRHDHTGFSSSGSERSGDAEQTFNITKSLNLALRHLRHQDRERVIWIDALCINQGSIRERNYAIPFMVDVYRFASSVVLFLGEENKKKNFTRIWQLMTMLRSTIEEALPEGGMSGPLTPQHDIQGLVDRLTFGSKDGKPEGERLFRVHLSLAAEDFFEYQWFQRVWVVQEVMNARRTVVYCGDQKREWIDILVFFCTAVKNSRSYAGALSGSLDLRDRLPPFLWTKLLAAQRGQHQKEGETPSPPHLPLLEVLTRARAFAATDPRDKIFALLSFGEETHDIEALPPRLKPDYAKSSSDVWKDVTRQWIIDHQSLDILGIRHEEVDKNNQIAQKTVYISAQNQPKLSNAESRFLIERPPSDHPSWALWHAEHPVSAKTALFRLDQPLPACQIPIDIKILDQPVDSSMLSLRGVYIDQIKSVQWPFKRWNFSEHDIRQFNYHTQPPTSLDDGVPIAWAALLGAVQGMGECDTQQVKVKFPKELQIPPYPSGKSLMQAFIEALICRRFKQRFKLDGSDEFMTDLISSLSALKLEDVKEQGDSHDSNPTPAKGVEAGSDIEAMSHFAAHWAQSRCDPEMKWIPEPAAGVFRKLVKHGDSRKFTEMCEFAEGRCFFQTKKGAFGLCPQETQPDDIVVSLSGGRTPYVLRQLKVGDSTAQKYHWVLVGECYVHDLDIAKMTSMTWEARPEAVQVFDIS